MWAVLASFPLFQNGHANNIWTTSVKKTPAAILLEGPSANSR